jgi:hypothetical protein
LGEFSVFFLLHLIFFPDFIFDVYAAFKVLYLAVCDAVLVDLSKFVNLDGPDRVVKDYDFGQTFFGDDFEDDDAATLVNANKCVVFLDYDVNLVSLFFVSPKILHKLIKSLDISVKMRDFS